MESKLHKNYSNYFNLRVIELVSLPRGGGEKGVNDKVIFKELRFWQDGGCILLHLPATVGSLSSSTILPVEVIPNPAPTGEMET